VFFCLVPTDVRKQPGLYIHANFTTVQRCVTELCDMFEGNCERLGLH
jgi:hypothetical protein